MKAMVFERAGRPLVERDVPAPQPAPGQLLLEVEACGVCRTDLHVFDGDLECRRSPLILGHEIVGRVRGGVVTAFTIGQRVGVPWLGGTCGACRFCRSERENLCDDPVFTGYTVDGGYAEYAVADARYCFLLDDAADPSQLAPLLCAGLIGYRSYRMAGEARRLGLYGFGAAAHLLAQIAVQQGRDVYAFTRPGDHEGQRFARSLGVAWSGGSDQAAPQELDAAIIFAPVGELIPVALRAVGKGGNVVCAGIHMSDIPAFPYELLWGERAVRSVANLTRQDGEEFFTAATAAGLRASVQVYDLSDANRALEDLRSGAVQGAGVLVP